MKSISRFVASILLIAGVLGFASATQASDIVPGSALEKEMQAMINQGILLGYGEGVYKPKDKVTREQFAAFINRALKLPAGIHNFKDVPMNSKLSADIGAVYTAGLMAGINETKFDPTTLITREQMAQTLNNVLDYSGMELIEKRVSFSDENDFVSSGGLKAVYNILHYDITAGMPDGKGGLKFAPNDSTTREQAAAFIYRFLEAQKTAPAPDAPPTENPAPIPYDPNHFYLGYVEKGKFVKQEYGHKDYASAAASFKAVPSAKAILRGDEILHIRSGVAFGNRVLNGQKQVTNIYSDPAFKKQATYIEHDREIGYLDSTADYVKVQVGGTVGYVKHSEVDFVPEELMTNQDYYMVNQWGTLVHYQYNYVTKTRASYSIGPAPKEMKANVQYHSRDGVHFDSGTTIITHYPYFQYQSVRTKSGYTAEELDRFITQRLKELNSTSGTYKDASKRSKLIGTGKYFIAMQEKYNVNALFMLSAAMHESAYGMSANAQTKNNLFGIRVFDGSPHEGTVYAQPQNSIDAFAREYMNLKYVNPNGTYANGASPGNKTTGLNVSYASDPTWGSKVAGHMFRTDLALGNKDINQYQLGITNTPLTKVRHAPQGDLLYTYKREYLGVENAFGYPVVILDKVNHTDGYTWYKVISDLNPDKDPNQGIGWIREDLVDRIN